jgi:hypothetical protein
MSAVLKELPNVADFQPIRVFDSEGKATDHYRLPERELSVQDFYGSITGQFEQRPREKILALLNHASLAIRFDKFTDGRPYTLAHRLRELGYMGELHAVGDINQEIVHHLRRVGFTHFHLSQQDASSDRLDASVLYPFGGHYQRTAVESVRRHSPTADTYFDMFAID